MGQTNVARGVIVVRTELIVIAKLAKVVFVVETVAVWWLCM